jgi:hypothetical protein
MRSITAASSMRATILISLWHCGQSNGSASQTFLMSSRQLPLRFAPFLSCGQAVSLRSALALGGDPAGLARGPDNDCIGILQHGRGVFCGDPGPDNEGQLGNAARGRKIGGHGMRRVFLFHIGPHGNVLCADLLAVAQHSPRARIHPSLIGHVAKDEAFSANEIHPSSQSDGKRGLVGSGQHLHAAGQIGGLVDRTADGCHRRDNFRSDRAIEVRNVVHVLHEDGIAPSSASVQTSCTAARTNSSTVCEARGVPGNAPTCTMPMRALGGSVIETIRLKNIYSGGGRPSAANNSRKK